MSETFTIFATVKTPLAQKDFVRLLQYAYDGGAAGFFEVKPCEGGFYVAFLRDREDDDLPETVEQLAEEIGSAEFAIGKLHAEDNADHVIAFLVDVESQVRETGWLPFPPGKEGGQVSENFSWPNDAKQSPPIFSQVRLTQPYETLLYADDEGNFLLDESNTEVSVPVPAGTLCYVTGLAWIGGEQGWAFYLTPMGDDYPDAVPGQFDLADLGDGTYPFVVVED